MDEVRIKNRVGSFYLNTTNAITAAEMPDGFDFIRVTANAVFTHLKEAGLPSYHEEVTLVGTDGTANITSGGLTLLATFVSTLTQTAIDFVTAHAAEYLTQGITVTADTGVLIFVSARKELNTSIANVADSLTGTVEVAALFARGIDGLKTVNAGALIGAATKFTEVTLQSGAANLE